MAGRHTSPSADGVRFATGNSLVDTLRSRFRTCGVSEGPPTCEGVRQPRFAFRFTSNELRWRLRRREYTVRVRGPFSFIPTMGDFSATDASLFLCSKPHQWGCSKLRDEPDLLPILSRHSRYFAHSDEPAWQHNRHSLPSVRITRLMVK